MYNQNKSEKKSLLKLIMEKATEVEEAMAS